MRFPLPPKLQNTTVPKLSPSRTLEHVLYPINRAWMPLTLKVIHLCLLSIANNPCPMSCPFLHQAPARKMGFYLPQCSTPDLALLDVNRRSMLAARLPLDSRSINLSLFVFSLFVFDFVMSKTNCLLLNSNLKDLWIGLIFWLGTKWFWLGFSIS